MVLLKETVDWALNMLARLLLCQIICVVFLSLLMPDHYIEVHILQPASCVCRLLVVVKTLPSHQQILYHIHQF
jgi:hypothetical protein